MKLKMAVLATASCFMLSGCDFENPYTIYQLEKQSKIVVLEHLKDPESAKFRNVNKNCGEVNAANSYGGYTGYVRYVVRLKANGGKGDVIIEDSDLQYYPLIKLVFEKEYTKCSLPLTKVYEKKDVHCSEYVDDIYYKSKGFSSDATRVQGAMKFYTYCMNNSLEDSKKKLQTFMK